MDCLCVLFALVSIGSAVLVEPPSFGAGEERADTGAGRDTHMENILAFERKGGGFPHGSFAYDDAYGEGVEACAP